MKKELKRLFAEYETAVDETARAEMLYDEEPENESYENAFDEAYKREYNAMMEIARYIHKITFGNISLETAATMVDLKYDELKILASRLIA